MTRMLAFLTAWLLTATAAAGDVYVTTDAQGHKVYTDTPQEIPAKKLDIHSESTDQDAVAKEYSSEMKRYDQADEARSKAQAQQSASKESTRGTAAERAKRCADAKQQYQVLVNNWRIYEPGPNGERTYLTAEQIDKQRADLKKYMDQACAEQ